MKGMITTASTGSIGHLRLPGAGSDSKYYDKKPIFIVRLPETSNNETLDKVSMHFKNSKISKDYYILVIRSHDPELLDIRFEMFNCSEMTDTNWNTLTSKVLDDLDPGRILRREAEELIEKESGGSGIDHIQDEHPDYKGDDLFDEDETE